MLPAMLTHILTGSSLILFHYLALHHLCVLLPGWQACCTADAWHVGIGHHPSASHFFRPTFGRSIVANTKPLAVKYGAPTSKNGYDSLNLNSPRKSPFLNLQAGNDEARTEEVADDLYTPDVTGGRVKNLSRHVDFLDKSLEKSSGRGIFRRINDALWEENSSSSNSTNAIKNITTAQELDVNTRFGILSHGTQPDPIYNYGNVASLILFEQTIDRLCKTPSRYSTVPELMEDRAQLIQQIEEVGYGYITKGVRTTTQGKLFIIEQNLIWTVFNDKGERIGLAAMYDREGCVPYSE